MCIINTQQPHENVNKIKVEAGFLAQGSLIIKEMYRPVGR